VQEGDDASPLLGAEVYATTVTVSGGTATLVYTDVEGIDGTLAGEPFLYVTGTDGSEAVSAKGATEATIEAAVDGDVDVLLVTA